LTCYSPLKAHYAPEKKANGKREILWNQEGNKLLEQVTLPCGQCLGCRLDRSRMWAVRCVKEADLHEENCFITLTYDDKNLPEGRTLIKKDFQDFMKRLRKKISPRKVRYYMCGEYGSKFGRPHYHAILFGYNFPDLVPVERSNPYQSEQLYSSSILERTWQKGFVSVGAVTLESAAYVARYIMKKITGEMEDEHYWYFDRDTGEIYDRTPEYQACSRRPGIAHDWFLQFGSELYPDDFITHKGKDKKISKIKVPRYFDKMFELISPGEYEEVKQKRKEKAEKYKDENTPERLSVRQKVKWAQIKNLKRNTFQRT
jgi:hypothetical protein